MGYPEYSWIEDSIRETSKEAMLLYTLKNEMERLENIPRRIRIFPKKYNDS